MPPEDSVESTGSRLGRPLPRSRRTDKRLLSRRWVGGQTVTPTGGQNPLAVVRFGGITRAAGREFFLVNTRPSVVVRRLVPGAPFRRHTEQNNEPRARIARLGPLESCS